jgi:hypothetical protein
MGPACVLPPPSHDTPEDKPHNQFMMWGGAEYLLWWVKNQPLGVPLVTTGSPATLGVLGSPDTTVLFGNSDLDYHTFSGGRFTLGMGFGWEGNLSWGVEGTGLFLEKRPVGYQANSAVTGVPLLARPIVNALTGAETSALISDPGVASGSINAVSHNDLYGWEVNLACGSYRDGPLHVTWLGGFRYLNVSEDFDIAQATNLLPNGAAGLGGTPLMPPSTVVLYDHFGTRNEFYGGQLGARAEYGLGHLFFSAQGKIALGSVHEVISLGGFTGGSGPNTVMGIAPGGLLALSSNAGSRSHNEFAAVPEIGINVGYQISAHLRVFVGYTFLYCSDVVRPGDEINRTVNPTLVPSSRTFGQPLGPAEPSFSLQRTDFWAQGANFGLEFHF